jgi:hypothetical protein
MQYAMLIQIWLGAFKTMIYLWGLVEANHKKKTERHARAASADTMNVTVKTKE